MIQLTRNVIKILSIVDAAAAGAHFFMYIEERSSVLTILWIEENYRVQFKATTCFFYI